MGVDRARLLAGSAGQFARTALSTVRREFPYALRHVTQGPDDRPGRPSEVHPAFYGSYDWHSCVEMQWTLVRLLRCQSAPRREIRELLDERLSADAVATEARFVEENPGYSRPYGYGWVLQLAHETATSPDPRARAWATNLAPLTEVISANFVEWLPKLTYPVRQGAHFNTAFGLSRVLDFATDRAAIGDRVLLDAVTEAALRLFRGDRSYPGHYEPDGADFLSPALTEAELMSRVLGRREFADWFSAFLPGVERGEPAALFVPARVSDASDGQIAHLHGLNLSRAWGWRRLAESLSTDDRRLPTMVEAALRHADAALPHVSGGDYMVEHWLAAYAVLYLS